MKLMQLMKTMNLGDNMNTTFTEYMDKRQESCKSGSALSANVTM